MKRMASSRYPLLITVGVILALVAGFFLVRTLNYLHKDFLTQRIKAAMESTACPPVKKPNYPAAYYQGPLTDTHLHIPAIPDWPPAEDSRLTAEQRQGRFDGEKALLGWNVTMSEIACSIRHEGTRKNFGFFPVFEEIPKPLIEVAHQTVKQYPELFTPFIGASGNDGDPNGFPVTDAATLGNMLSVYPGLFQGFGEIGLYAREGGGSKALPPDAPRLQSIYPLIKQHNLLVYFHPGRGQTRSLERVLSRHQEINFIVHGEEVEASLDYLMSKHPNLYYGIELGLGEENPEFSRLFVEDDKEKFLAAMDKEFNRALADHLRKWKPLIEKYPDRFIWGTDRGDVVWQYDREVGQALVKLARAFIGRLDPGVQEKFAYKNAEKLATMRSRRAADEFKPADPSRVVIGYAGCSITYQTVEGYRMVGGRTMWPPEPRYDDGSVMNWGNPRMRFLQVFDENLQKYPATSIIWWQLCLPSHEFPTYEQANEVITAIKARLPEAAIYVSSLAPYEHLCEGSGETGVARGQKLAEELAARRADVKLGPVFSTLTVRDTENDLCHLETPGKLKLGQDLKEFFDG